MRPIRLASGFSKVALIPILSDARGVALVVKKWMRKNRLPDAIVIEHPQYAGGHLGASKKEDLGDSRFEARSVLESVLELFKELRIERERIPLISGGGSIPMKKSRSCSGSAPARCRSAPPSR